MISEAVKKIKSQSTNKSDKKKASFSKTEIEAINKFSKQKQIEAIKVIGGFA